MASATLHPAWLYDCEICGKQNVVREIRLPEEVCKNLAEYYAEEVRPWGFVPDTVTCEHCGMEAEVVVEGEE